MSFCLSDVSLFNMKQKHIVNTLCKNQFKSCCLQLDRFHENILQKCRSSCVCSSVQEFLAFRIQPLFYYYSRIYLIPQSFGSLGSIITDCKGKVMFSLASVCSQKAVGYPWYRVPSEGYFWSHVFWRVGYFWYQVPSQVSRVSRGPTGYLPPPPNPELRPLPRSVRILLECFLYLLSMWAATSLLRSNFSCTN